MDWEIDHVAIMIRRQLHPYRYRPKRTDLQL